MRIQHIDGIVLPFSKSFSPTTLATNGHSAIVPLPATLMNEEYALDRERIKGHAHRIVTDRSPLAVCANAGIARLLTDRDPPHP